MKRLCFLLPNIEVTRSLVADLKSMGIDAGRIHLLANRDTPLGDLPDAGADQTDFVPALERGLAAGAAVGLVAGLVALRAAGGVLGGAAVLLIMLETSLISGWLTAIAGSAFPSTRLKKFKKAIDAGQVLIMIDTMVSQADELSALVRKHHPEAEIEGFEPPPPILPT